MPERYPERVHIPSQVFTSLYSSEKVGIIRPVKKVHLKTERDLIQRDCQKYLLTPTAFVETFKESSILYGLSGNVRPGRLFGIHK